MKLCLSLVLIRFSCAFPFCSEQIAYGWHFVTSNYLLTWSALALFLACRTEFAFSIGHFLIILPFHSLSATFQVYIFLIFDLFWSHCFGWNRSKVVLGLKLMNTFNHGRSFVSLLLIFNFFPKINHFSYYTCLHGLQDVENHCTHLEDIELKTGWKFHISTFPCVILYIIGLRSMKLQN